MALPRSKAGRETKGGVRLCAGRYRCESSDVTPPGMAVRGWLWVEELWPICRGFIQNYAACHLNHRLCYSVECSMHRAGCDLRRTGVTALVGVGYPPWFGLLDHCICTGAAVWPTAQTAQTVQGRRTGRPAEMSQMGERCFCVHAHEVASGNPRRCSAKLRKVLAARSMGDDLDYRRTCWWVENDHIIQRCRHVAVACVAGRQRPLVRPPQHTVCV